METLIDYENTVAENPRLVLVSFKKIEDGFEMDGTTPSFAIEYINPPKSYRLHSNPIEPENVCILEVLDYEK